jgi:hypothetical protein
VRNGSVTQTLAQPTEEGDSETWEHDIEKYSFGRKEGFLATA